MGYITILKGGDPWIICCPPTQQDLENFLSLSKNEEVGADFTTRAATDAERGKLTAARMLNVHKHADYEEIFGIEA